MLALERGLLLAKPSKLWGDLAVKYGYSDSEAKKPSVSDPDECWVFEIVGPGPLWEVGDSEPGAFWVAARARWTYRSIVQLVGDHRDRL